MTKRKKRTKKKESQPWRLWAMVGVIFVLAIIASFAFYKAGYEKGFEEGALKAHDYYEKKLTRLEKKLSKKQASSTKKVSLKPTLETFSEIKDYQQNYSSQKKSPPKKVSRSLHGHPKLAIIIDDVAFGYQVRALKGLHLPLNLSFFPPTKVHPNTPKLASTVAHYMIHLPMEAMHYAKPEPQTLLVNMSKEQIQKRIQNIRHWFPKAKFVNNHTGSRFTANKEAMRRLIEALDRYGFGFVDSRTTSTTKVAEVQKEFGHRYLARDIFLDNDQNVTYIQNQLKKAVRLAKRRGVAIAIGHPHKATIEALRRSKHLLKGVELIYIDSLPY